MESQTNLYISCASSFPPLQTGAQRSSSTGPSVASRAAYSARATIALVVVASGAACVSAQQPYTTSPYGGYNNPYPAQPPQQYDYGQPQYEQPQYANPQYAQPNAQQPQYAAPQPYPQQPYAQQQPYGEQASPYPQQDLSAPAPAQALSASDLEQLLAPIALYPDALLAQILAASTYPAQVAVADEWLQQMRAQGYGSPDQIAAGAGAQTTWDPSVKALTAFPDVLDMLNHNLEWTTNLGNAYYNQPQDVMQTVQVLRQRAEQAGNLQPTPQEQITNDQGYIDLAPTNPEQVSVPTYNPWNVYGQPISPYPGFSLLGALGDFFGSSPIQYGLSFAMGAFEHTPFGLLAWGLDWLSQAIQFDHGNYYSRSNTVADWGLPHGGPRAYMGWRGPERARDNSYRAYGGGNYSQHGDWANNQRGNWQNNRGFGQNNSRAADGIPYSPQRSEQFNRGNEGFDRAAEGYNRGYQQPAYSYTHPFSPAQQAYNRAASQPGDTYRPQTSLNSSYGYHPQTYPNHPPTYASRAPAQSFSNGAYGYGYANRSTYGYAGRTDPLRPSYAYGGFYSSHAPRYDPSRAYAGHPYQSYGNTTARNENSHGFYLFDGNKAPRSLGNERAPKFSYKTPKSFSHERAPRAPKMSHSGGGGGHKHFL